MTGRVERTSVSTTFWRSCPSNGRRRLTYQWNRGARAPRSSTAARAFPSSFLSLSLLLPQAFLRRRRRGCARTASRGRSATSSADRRTTAGREDPSGGGGGVSPERASRRASLRRGIGAGEHERGGGRRRRDAPAFNFRLSAGVGGVRAAWWVAETGNTPTEARRARREMIHDVGGGVR